MNRRQVVVAIIVAMAVPLAGCEKQPSVTIPAADNSPPHVELTAHGDSYTVTLTPQSGPAQHTFATTDHLIIDAHGVDLESGIKKVTITGGYSVKCRDPLSSENTTHTSANTIDRETVAPAPNASSGDIVFTNLYATDEAFGDLAGFQAECQLGEILVGVGGSVTATAENYLGGKSTTSEFSFGVAVG